MTSKNDAAAEGAKRLFNAALREGSNFKRPRVAHGLPKRPEPLRQPPPQEASRFSTPNSHLNKPNSNHGKNSNIYMNQSKSNNQSRQIQHSSSSNQNNYWQTKKWEGSQINRQMKKSFVSTFSALVSTLQAAFADPTLRIVPASQISPEVKAKSKESLIPIVTNNGLKVSAVSNLIMKRIENGRKPFWLTRHHSGGFQSYLAFFPTVFSVCKGGSTVFNLPNTPEKITDVDRVSFASPEMQFGPVKVNVSEIFDNFEKSGFDPPLLIARELPFELAPCVLPENFEIIYGYSKSVCDEFVKSRLVMSVNADGTWNCYPNQIIGLDTETTQQMFVKQSAPSPPCLIQLSTRTACLLVHQKAILELPDSIKWVLEHNVIKKVVVGAKQERKDLARFGIQPNQILDVYSAKSSRNNSFDPRSSIESDSSDVVEKSAQKMQIGLGTMAAKYLGLKMAKPRNIQVGDWKKPLSQDQMNYAATDAWVSLLVYQVLQVPGQGDLQNVKWWDDGQNILRRFACVDPAIAFEERLKECGLFRIEGTGQNGEAVVFAERPSCPVDRAVLGALYVREY